jgi:hypothetical protein
VLGDQVDRLAHRDVLAQDGKAPVLLELRQGLVERLVVGSRRASRSASSSSSSRRLDLLGLDDRGEDRLAP